VASGYAFFALNERGEVVYGREPEYEDVSVVASSFDEFLGKLVTKSPDLPLEAFSGA
jgi:hypothetical protein